MLLLSAGRCSLRQSCVDVCPWPCRRYSFFGRSSSCRLSAEGFQDRFIEA
jgi:hypothetical protein